MSKNINGVFTTNPLTANLGTDLMYFGQSPYGITNDAAMLFSNFSKQFVTSLSGVNGVTVSGSLPSLTIGLSTIPSLTLLGNNAGVTGAVGDVPFSTFLQTSNNLSELTPTAATARSNLGITAAGTATPSALTSANDNNVTLSLSGTPGTAALQPVLFTMGWTGQLGIARGGTGASSFNVNGVVLSGSTTTSPHTAVTLADGQVVIGSSTGAPTAASITAGTGITVTPGHNSITIASSGGAGISWVDQATSSATLAVNTGYVCNNGSTLITFTLPAIAAEGSVIEIAGNSAGGWTVTQAAGQSIKLGSQTSTTGTGGSISSSNAGDCVRLLCVVANTTFRALSGWGNITFV